MKSSAPAPHGESAQALNDLPLLYIIPTCPWCVEVMEFLDERGLPYRRLDITSDSAARAEMEKKSGQTKVPTMDWDGRVLADFGVEELIPFLRGQNVKLEDS